MQVAQYTFQSPSASQVQIGKLDPSSKEEDTASKTSEKSISPAKTAGEIMTGQPLESATVTSNVNARLLDVYA